MIQPRPQTTDLRTADAGVQPAGFPERLVLYDGGHFATPETAVPVVNAWLDQTLGVVRR